MGERSWVALAACRGRDTSAFYPAKGRGLSAKAVCADCPVTAECLSFALRHDEQGVWGGTNAQERERMRGKRLTLASLEGYLR